MFDNLFKLHGSFKMFKSLLLKEDSDGASRTSTGKEFQRSGARFEKDQHDCSPGTDGRNSPVLWCNGGELAVGVSHMTQTELLVSHIGEHSRQIVRSIDQQCW